MTKQPTDYNDGFTEDVEVSAEISVEEERSYERGGVTAGRSPERPITVGDLLVSASSGNVVNIYIDLQFPGEELPPRCVAPDEIVSSGSVYVLDGSETVNILFPHRPVAGIVNLIVRNARS